MKSANSVVKKLSVFLQYDKKQGANFYKLTPWLK